MSGTDIFLSYARKDQATARLFADTLGEEGFSVWWDASLHSGETFDEVIEQRLRESKAVVVLWSPRSVASRWVRAEATLADRRNKLVPAIIEPCDRPIIFELTHAAELSDWTGEMTDRRWQTFVSDLRRLVDKPSEQAPAAAAAPEPAPAPVVAPEPAQPVRLREVEKPAERPQPAAQKPRQPVEAVANDPHSSEEFHCLEIEPGELIGDPVLVTSSSMKIGRTAPADIILAHKSVSREHCMVGLANDELIVTDLNSTNGTYIDGVRVARGSILPVGSVLQIGQVALRHSIRRGGQAQEPPSRFVAGPMQSGRFAAAS